MKETLRYLRENLLFLKIKWPPTGRFHYKPTLRPFLQFPCTKLNPRTLPAEKPTIHSLLHTGGVWQHSTQPCCRTQEWWSHRD